MSQTIRVTCRNGQNGQNGPGVPGSRGETLPPGFGIQTSPAPLTPRPSELPSLGESLGLKVIWFWRPGPTERDLPIPNNGAGGGGGDGEAEGEREAEHRSLTTKLSIPSTGSICHNSSQATSYFQTPSKSWHRGNQPLEVGGRHYLSCRDGLQGIRAPPGNGPVLRSKTVGGRKAAGQGLLLYKHDSWRDQGQAGGTAGQGKQPFNKQGRALRIPAWRGLVRPLNPATWATE